jgi:hypothetical protein
MRRFISIVNKIRQFTFLFADVDVASRAPSLSIIRQKKYSIKKVPFSASEVEMEISNLISLFEFFVKLTNFLIIPPSNSLFFDELFFNFEVKKNKF